jgi:hypothetical protein
VLDFDWGLVLLGVYVLLVVLARWIYIARPNVVWTSAQAGAMSKRLSFPWQAEPDSPTDGKAPVLQPALLPLLEEIKEHNPATQRSGVIGWNGSHQIAQWVLMHEAERLALPTLGHAQLVARLERALGQLGELPQPRREAWEDVIHTLLAAKDEADTERLEHTYRAYLDEILGEIYEASNGNAIQLAGLYNRATWVILVSLLPLAVLAGFGYGVLLVAGRSVDWSAACSDWCFPPASRSRTAARGRRCSARRCSARWRPGPGWSLFPCCRRRACCSSPPCTPPLRIFRRRRPRCLA